MIDLEISYEDIVYTVKDVEYDAYCPGDRWTPPCPAQVTGFGKVYDEDGKDVTYEIDWVKCEDDFFELLDEAFHNRF
jgi:hypothetical protein